MPAGAGAVGVVNSQLGDTAVIIPSQTVFRRQVFPLNPVFRCSWVSPAAIPFDNAAMTEKYQFHHATLPIRLSDPLPRDVRSPSILLHVEQSLHTPQYWCPSWQHHQVKPFTVNRLYILHTATGIPTPKVRWPGRKAWLLRRFSCSRIDHFKPSQFT